jgi:hypothetical protein
LILIIAQEVIQSRGYSSFADEETGVRDTRNFPGS